MTFSSACVDVFASDYLTSLTQFGEAITFSLDVDKSVIENDKSDQNEINHNNNNNFGGKNVNVYKINLHDKRFATNQSPILSDCKCFCCTKHTRAYLHHLLNTQEMLANILLAM